MKVYSRNEVFELGTTFESKCDRNGTTIRRYKVVEIYRTFNSQKELLKITYDAIYDDSKNGIYGINHEALKLHLKSELNK